MNYSGYTKHEVTGDKKIIISEEGEPFSIDTDPVLLRRILGNMTKNALEASESNGVVTLSAFQKGEKSTFSVHNNSYMEREVQLQVFNRSFSTKGKGRGIGTYSIKLFSEKYLKGKVYFDSSRKKGTTFYLELNNEFNP
jgi:signal transduction histidine kinase